MLSELHDRTKIASYFLWEYTAHSDTLALWYCAEDIACFLERCGMNQADDFYNLLKLNKNTREYVSFVRHIAYRVYLYTGCCDEIRNWYIAERLLYNYEWRAAVTYVADSFARYRTDKNFDTGQIKSETIKKYYSDLT